MHELCSVKRSGAYYSIIIIPENRSLAPQGTSKFPWAACLGQYDLLMSLPGRKIHQHIPRSLNDNINIFLSL